MLSVLLLALPLTIAFVGSLLTLSIIGIMASVLVAAAGVPVFAMGGLGGALGTVGVASFLAAIGVPAASTWGIAQAMQSAWKWVRGEVVSVWSSESLEIRI
jgi:hypothetical protein